MKYGNTTVGGMSFGSVKIGGARMGNVLVYRQGTRPPILPEGYTELQYVDTNSEAYINTGIAGNTDNLSITAVFTIRNYIQYGAVYGNYQGELYNTWRAIINDSSHLLVCANAQATVGTLVPFALNAKHTLNVIHGSCTMDGVQYTLSTYKRGENNVAICLGNRTTAANPGIVARDIGLRIFSFQIRNNDEPVRNYVPCKRDSDSAVGLYDTINDTFNPSATATPFVAGPNK